MKKIIIALLFAAVLFPSIKVNAVNSPPSPAVPIVLSPNGGEQWAQGSTQIIRWSAPSSNYVNINLLTTCQGGSICPIAISTLATNIPNSGSYNWTIPLYTATNQQYTISVVDSSSGLAGNSGSFNIISGVVTKQVIPIIAPNGGEQWAVGSAQVIRWTAPSNISNVNIGFFFVCQVNGIPCPVTPLPIATNTPNSGSYNWTIPSYITSTGQYTVFISDAGSSGITGSSAQPFTITSLGVLPRLQIISPNGGEQWAQGSTQTIKWIAPSNISSVNISSSFSCSPGAYCIAPSLVVATNVPNNGSYNWTIPSYTVAGQYTMLIADAGSSGASSASATPFSVISGVTTRQVIPIIAPNGGEQWAQGSTQVVKWTAPSNVSNVNITLNTYIACLQSWPACYIPQPAPIIIASNVPDSGTYSWSIGTSIPVGTYTMTVADAGSSGITGNSASAFSVISGVVTVPPPTGLGASLPNGIVVQLPGSLTAYLIVNGMLQPFTSASIFLAKGYKWSDIQQVQSSQVSSQAISTIPVAVPDGSIIKGSAQTIFLIKGGARLGIPSLDVFYRLGLSFKNLVQVSDGDLQNYSDGGIQH